MGHHVTLSIGPIELFDIQSVCKDLCLVELLEIELFDQLSVWKQMTDV